MSAAPAVLAARTEWGAFDAAVARARDAGFEPAFWWRDDDAVADTPALARLLALSRDLRLPVALAVVPARAERSLAARLADEPLATALVHGLAHANHAPPRERKAEFGPHRPLPVLVQEAEQALAAARAALGPKVVPIFVPPWNRIAPALTAALPGLGYRGLSTFKDRAVPSPAPGLVQVNAHLDPIAWTASRSLADPAALIASLATAISDRLAGRADRAEPIGLLTHHLAHDEAVWRFCEDFLVRTSGYHRMRFLPVAVLLDEQGGTELGAPPR
jgi:hypothetical protein